MTFLDDNSQGTFTVGDQTVEIGKTHIKIYSGKTNTSDFISMSAESMYRLMKFSCDFNIDGIELTNIFNSMDDIQKDILGVEIF